MTVCDLSLSQAKAGEHVHVICASSDERMRSLLATNGVQVHEWNRIAGHGRTLQLRSILSLRQILHAADAIHIHTVKSLVLSLLLAPGSYVLRSVSTIHNTHQRSSVLMYVARRVVSLSAYEAGVIRSRTLSLVRPHVIRNGAVGSLRLALSAESAGCTLELPQKTILFVGGLNRRKGLDVLIAAMAEVVRSEPEAHLVVVGNRDNPEMESLPQKFGVGDSVMFMGYSSHVLDLMRRASVFVLPSREEAFGNVLTEARVAGAPIVATRVGGIPEALSAGRAGLLVPPEDPHALAVAIVRVLTDRDLADTLRQGGKDGLDEYSVAVFAQAYRRVYESVSK